ARAGAARLTRITAAKAFMTFLRCEWGERAECSAARAEREARGPTGAGSSAASARPMKTRSAFTRRRIDHELAHQPRTYRRLAFRRPLDGRSGVVPLAR